MNRNYKLMLTCEHASNALPEDGAMLEIPEDVLKSHRGYDIGAADIYHRLADMLEPDFMSEGQYSRLYVDLNRHIGSRTAFSEYWRNVPVDRRKPMMRAASEYHAAYREHAMQFAEQCISAGMPVLHLAIHSFTGTLDGMVRTGDVGVLYDPGRRFETIFATGIVDEIKGRAPDLRVRRNYPYAGKSDGLCTAIRKRVGEMYAGIEIEVCQRMLDL